MFIDEITLHLKAGRGGDGVVRWRHEKGIDKGGPAGGNGGKGGDVYALGTRDIGVLNSYKEIKVFSAEDGFAGEARNRQGKEGKDISIKLPVGSVIKNLETGHIFEIKEEGETVKLLTGGRGGLGNSFFKSSINRSPKETTLGELGGESDFYIELQLVVDFGLIGLPNAGKSSLLNALTSAKSKVGSFPFTTIEPHLGDMHGVILGDIPGLIEGASQGKGLGHKFLRHIRRTKGLIHLVSCEESHPLDVYKIVRNELLLYNKDILSKPETILLTKTDMISKEDLEDKVRCFEEIGKEVIPISILDEATIKNLKDFLTKKSNE